VQGWPFRFKEVETRPAREEDVALTASAEFCAEVPAPATTRADEDQDTDVTYKASQQAAVGNPEEAEVVAWLQMSKKMWGSEWKRPNIDEELESSNGWLVCPLGSKADPWPLHAGGYAYK